MHSSHFFFFDWWLRSFERNHIFYVGKPHPAEAFTPLATVLNESTKEATAKKMMYRHLDEKPRPKSVLLPGTPPEIAYAPPRQSYYEGRSGVPFHNAVGTEMKKTMRMDESTENTRRIVTVEQTSRVIKFGENKQENSSSGLNSNVQHHQQNSFSVPVPRKFVQGQLRESDYESDADTSRIRAKWAPPESDTEEPRYRKVSAPSPRSPIVTWPSESENERSESERRSMSYVETRSRQMQPDNTLKPGSPPEFAYATGQQLKKTANRKANHGIHFFFTFFSNVIFCPRHTATRLKLFYFGLAFLFLLFMLV